MKKKVLALCVRDASYLKRLTEYLKGRETFPFEVFSYTEPEGAVAFAGRAKVDLFVAEAAVFEGELARAGSGRTIVLAEGRTPCGDAAAAVDKYGRAEEIYGCIMAYYRQTAGREEAERQREGRAVLLAFYSPVGRCLQTSFALTFGQALSRKYRTLYVSFEAYAGWNGLLSREGRADLSDLLCCMEEDGEKFRERLRGMEGNAGGLLYIPPVYAGQNLVYITAGQWKRLLEKLEREGGYDYVLLDLSDGLQGVYEMLRMCARVYTIEKEDGMAAGKIAQYERLLWMQDYGDVLEKTDRRRLPVFHSLPSRMERYTKGELADYVRNLIEEEFGLGDE